jgi:hypothetical protein
MVGKMSEDTLHKSIYQNFNSKETSELVQIWQENKRYEWSDLAFDVVQQILEERGVSVPPQAEAQIAPESEQKKEADDDDKTITNAIADSENQPIFYKPQQLMFFADATSKAAWIILAVNVVFTLWQYLRYFLATYSPADLGIMLSAISFPAMILQMTGHAINFFMLKGISMGLYVLMEFEFNSRGVK